MKPETDSAAFDLLRQIIKENPNASKEELLRLFQKDAANDEEVKKAVPPALKAARTAWVKGGRIFFACEFPGRLR